MNALLVLVAALQAGAPGDSLQESLNYLSSQVHRGYVQQRLVVLELPPFLAGLIATVTNLYPETPLRLYLLRKADGNASALPDGGIYLRQGFLTETRNSEELIFVLAHEAAHVALEHVAGRCRDDPGLDLFSVEVEIEADSEALKRMRAANIATAGVRAFLERLIPEGESVRPSQLAARLARLSPAAAGAPGPLPAPLVELQREALKLLLSLGREPAVENYLAVLGGVLGSGERLAIEAELARRREQFERAEALFRDALRQAPEAALAWRGLALTLESGQRLEDSRAAWERVLELEPAAPDGPLIRAFVEQACQPVMLTDAAGAEHGPHPPKARLPEPWRLVRDGPAGILASPDSVDLTRLDIDRQGPPGPCPLSMVLLDRGLRELRARPGAPVLRLEAATATRFGALAQLSHGDETGVDWRLDVHAINGAAGQFRARFRAPARHYYQRWRDDAAAISAGYSGFDVPAAGGRGTR